MEEGDGKGTRYKHGLIIGKFMPLHKGHEHLIRVGLRSCDILTVLVCSIPGEPINGDLRYAWVKERFPSARVQHVTDVVPQTPEEHPNFWSIWKALIEREHPEKIDAVFTGEDYGDKLAEILHSKHVRVDRTRARFPISGTEIRRDPVKYWRFISKPARPSFVKKVLVYGAESTGKTTLARKLAQHYRTTWCPEYARDYVKDKLGNDVSLLSVNDQIPIAFGHRALEAEKLKRANIVMFTDTDAITTFIYFHHYFGYVDPQVLELSKREKYDLVLLNHPDVPWVQDPQRDLGHRRREMHSKFVEGLEARKMGWVDIKGTWDARWNQAIRAVDRLLSTKKSR